MCVLHTFQCCECIQVKLGVTLPSKLTYKSHTDSIRNKATKASKYLRKSKKKMTHWMMVKQIISCEANKAFKKQEEL